MDVKKLPVSEDDWKREHDEVSTTIRRVMITLIGYSFFCLLTLAAPDERLIRKDATIGIPFAGGDFHACQNMLLKGTSIPGTSECTPKDTPIRPCATIGNHVNGKQKRGRRLFAGYSNIGEVGKS